jgi:hypothetical protein
MAPKTADVYAPAVQMQNLLVGILVAPGCPALAACVGRFNGHWIEDGVVSCKLKTPSRFITKKIVVLINLSR